MFPLVGIPEVWLVSGMCGLVLLLLGLLAIKALKKPILFKMGMRNAVRRPAQAVLIIFGLMLSTVFITTSLIMGNSVNDSFKTAQLPQVGNLDEGISKQVSTIKEDIPYFNSQEEQTLVATLRTIPSVNQFAGAIVTPQQSVPVFDITTQQISAENAVLAVPPDFGNVWGTLQSTDGHVLDFHQLASEEVYIGHTLATKLNAHVGDTVNVFVNRQTLPFIVKAILNTDINPQGSTSQMLVVPLAQYQQILSRPGQVNTFFIKNMGQGGLSDLGPDNRMVSTITQTIQNHFQTYTVTPYKLNTLTNAASQGSVITQVVSAVGLLLILAGMLLIYLIFVMLASERRSEMGMSRAVGMRRSSLILVFVFEGLIYSLGSTLVGIPLGIGIAYLLLWSINHTTLPPIFNQFPFHLSVSWQSLVLSFSLGLLLTFLVVTFSAYQVSRMNIIAAIRNLENTPTEKRTFRELLNRILHPQQATRHLFLRYQQQQIGLLTILTFLRALYQIMWKLLRQGSLISIIGLICLLVGILIQSTFYYELGVSIGILGSGLLLCWLLPNRSSLSESTAKRIGMSWVGIGLLLYWIQPFGPWERIFGIYNLLNLGQFQTGPSLIFLSIALTIMGAIWLIMYNGELLIRGVMLFANHFGRTAPIARISMAYPLTYRFRTGLIVAMFALVSFVTILVIVLTSTINLNAQVDRYTGGWELQTDSANLPSDLVAQIKANPLLVREIDTNHIAWLDGQFCPMRQPLAGKKMPTVSILLRAVNDTFLDDTTVALQARATGYTNDRQIWNAVKQHPGLAVIWNDPLIGLRGTESSFQPFQIQVQASGEWQEVTVIGVLPTLTQWPGLYVSTRTGAAIFPTPIRPTWYNFRLRPGYTDNQVRLDMGRAFGAKYGIEVETLSEKLGWTIGTLDTIGLFLTGYLALGLIIGICGLGVITSRAVIERRQEIGMLRAIGYRRRLVAWSFLLESSFIALLGLLLGAILGLWSASQIATQIIPSRNVFQDTLHLPFGEIGAILLCAYLATLLTTYIPTRIATQVLPAEALRYE